MDRKIDLTLNRDFRQRSEKTSLSKNRPRSIFTNHISKKVIPKPSHTVINYGTNTIQNVYFNGSMYMQTYSGTTMSSNSSFVSANYGKVCDRCGADITRIPWGIKQRGYLCKKCDNILDTLHGQENKRIAWK